MLFRSWTQLYIVSLAFLFFPTSGSAHVKSLGVNSPWARPGNGPVGVIYANIHNPLSEGRALVHVKVCGKVCHHAELHTHILEGDIVKMRPVKKIELKPHEITHLEPGGLHIMMMGLKGPLKKGDVVPVTFIFDQGDPIKIGVPVQNFPPEGNSEETKKFDCPCSHQ